MSEFQFTMSDKSIYVNLINLFSSLENV